MSDVPFGSRLRALRRAAGSTLEELAQASGVSIRAISDMERGHTGAPQTRTLAALARALGLNSDERRQLDEAARAGRSIGGAGSPRLGGLPRLVPDFVGRTTELDLVRRHVAVDHGPPPVVVVHGQAGLGKTTFAVRAADELTARFPDGHFYVDLRGTETQPMAVGEALSRLLRALGVNPRRIGGTDEERSRQLRAVLHDRRCLLLLDNAASEAQVRPLLPGPAPGLVLVTSRRTLGGLDGVLRIPLTPLAPAESAQMLAAIAGQATDPAVTNEVEDVSRLCGYLPLALRIAGTRLATRPGWTVAHLAARLSDADRRLANLVAGDTGIAAAFALSHAQLSGDAQELFRRLAHVPGVDFAPPIASVLNGTNLFDVTDGLDELVELGLLELSGTDRYRFHDLIRLFARERLHIEEAAGTRSVTAKRMTDWLLETAIVAGRWFEPAYGSLPDQWTGLVALASIEEAGAWLQAEADNWLGALHAAADAGEHQLVVDVAEAMHWFSDSMLGWPGWYEVYGLSRAASAHLPDRHQEVTHLNYHAWAATYTVHRPDEGAATAMEAYQLAVEIGDVKEQGWALTYAAHSWRLGGQPDRTLWAYQQAQELADSVGDHDAYVTALTGIGLLSIDLERYDDALTHFRHLLREVEQRPLGPRPAVAYLAIAHTYASLVLMELGRGQEALGEAELALPSAVEVGDAAYVGRAYLMLGRARAALGARVEARRDLTQAVELLEGRMPEKYEAMARSELAAMHE
ncbi:helix-turn-helix domain-containing protein [Verrucosispora sp. WMMA2121]|uniref:ATP-binding protein n=1 Tax=Verrucosispora sp. WMMA2121 TaxID=3015164 RepID=UPI0022B5EBFF|nr:helix-turn-helix domain-containing protein [Verrucosispora sp. WMMA2121]MCZ7420044.1 helix-turn-helix domain-containing protein [Verrucosispora sp. WMMA2121]